VKLVDRLVSGSLDHVQPVSTSPSVSESLLLRLHPLAADLHIEPPVLRQNWIRQNLTKSEARRRSRSHGKKRPLEAEKPTNVELEVGVDHLGHYLAALHRKRHTSGWHSMAHSD
jgi:hypothetical protein